MIFTRLSTISVIAMLLLMLTVDTVMAARQSVFMLGNLRQWVDFSYSLNMNNHEASSVTQHYLTEKYNISLDYAVVSPRILNGSLALSLEGDQYSSSGSGATGSNGSTYGLQYDIKGSVLDKSPIPLSFILQSQIQEVQRSFGGDYLLNYDTYGATWSIRNGYLPVSVNFVRSVSTTHGLPDDREAVHNEVGIHAQHSAGRISLTSLDIISSDNDYTFTNSNVTDSSRSFDFNLRNYLHWDDGGKSRDLDSSARLREDVGINDSKNFSLNEALVWDLGRALRSGATYTLSQQTSFRGDQQTNAGTIWLQHLLYQSLTTNLMGNARSLKLENGSETEVGGRVSLVYKKILSQGSFLSLQTYKQYSVTDRHLTNSRFPVLDEVHQVLFGQNIPLNKPNVLPGTIVVRNENQSVRPLPYQEGIDYRVLILGAQTEIVVSGPGVSGVIADDSLLPNGNRLLISYDFLTDSDVRFATDSVGAGGDYSFRNGLLRVFARYDSYTQDALSNDATVQGQGLGFQTTYTAGGETRWNKFLISTQYSKTDGALQQSQYVDGTVNYNDVWGSGTISLFLTNSYHWYGNVNGIDRSPRRYPQCGGHLPPAYPPRRQVCPHLQLRKVHVHFQHRPPLRHGSVGLGVPKTHRLTPVPYWLYKGGRQHVPRRTPEAPFDTVFLIGYYYARYIPCFPTP